MLVRRPAVSELNKPVALFKCLCWNRAQHRATEKVTRQTQFWHSAQKGMNHSHLSSLFLVFIHLICVVAIPVTPSPVHPHQSPSGTLRNIDWTKCHFVTLSRTINYGAALLGSMVGFIFASAPADCPADKDAKLICVHQLNARLIHFIASNYLQPFSDLQWQFSRNISWRFRSSGYGFGLLAPSTLAIISATFFLLAMQ